MHPDDSEVISFTISSFDLDGPGIFDLEELNLEDLICNSNMKCKRIKLYLDLEHAFY